MWEKLSTKIRFCSIASVAAIVTTASLAYGQNGIMGNSFLTATGPGPENTQAYPGPMDTSQAMSADSAYPAPTAASQAMSADSAYPAPVVTSVSPVETANTPIPRDRIVAISSHGEVIDFNQEASKLSSKVIVSNGSKYIPPTEPPSQNGPSPMRIIGSDDRIQIDDTTVFPWTTVVRIQGQLTENFFFICSGWMLGQSTVVTAGHCIYDFTANKVWAYNVTITPAYNSTAQNPTPFGSCRAVTGIILSPWYNSGDMGYDYGVYQLDCRIGAQTGNLGFKMVSGDGVGTHVALTGYPVDKGGATMWLGLGSITSSDANSFYYDADTIGGQSGGPVWDFLDQNCRVCVVATHANEFDPPTMNQGPRIDTTAFNFLVSEQQFIALLPAAYLPIIMR